MLLELRRLTVPSGDHLLWSDITWDVFEQILKELGIYQGAETFLAMEKNQPILNIVA